ncbi:transposase [Streptomyces decoyicus]|uniref:transposase n=1 Tax=Streptomyces decoyicus TaxID=249567 RepID=UPI00363FF0B7
MPLPEARCTRIETLLPEHLPGRGGRSRDHHEVIGAIAWKYRTGSRWVHHLPEKYGSWRGPATGCGCGPPAAPGSACSPRCRPGTTPIRT